MKKYWLIGWAVVCIGLSGCAGGSSPASTPSEQEVVLQKYDAFLSGQTSAYAMETEETVSVTDFSQIDSQRGIDRFALYDVTGDGVPELITSSLTYSIFTYQGDRLLWIYESPVNVMNGSVTILENGAVLSAHTSTGVFYEYATFASDNTPSRTAFDCLESEEFSVYHFRGQEVTKDEWDTLTKDIFALKSAELTWQQPH